MVGYGKDDQVLAGYYMGIPCSVGSTYNQGSAMGWDKFRVEESGRISIPSRFRPLPTISPEICTIAQLLNKEEETTPKLSNFRKLWLTSKETFMKTAGEKLTKR